MKNSKSRLGNCDEYPGAKKETCNYCHQPFALDPLKGWSATPVIVEEVQINDFRGDDQVYFYHPKCHYLKSH
jgi:hypothetical protein